jgi:hypothetical protein
MKAELAITRHTARAIAIVRTPTLVTVLKAGTWYTDGQSVTMSVVTLMFIMNVTMIGSVNDAGVVSLGTTRHLAPRV